MRVLLHLQSLKEIKQFSYDYGLNDLFNVITFRKIKSKHTLPVLYGPTLGPGCLTVAVNSLPIIDLFLKVSPIRQQCYINICDD